MAANFTPSAATLAEYGPRDCPWPWPEVAGIFVGGCIERGVGSSFRRQAHAHNYPGTEHFGWVCVRSHRRLFASVRLPDGSWTTSERPSQLMLHEYAHLLAPGHGHDEHWMLAAHQLGYRFPAHEKRHSPAAWQRFQRILRSKS